MALAYADRRALLPFGTNGAAGPIPPAGMVFIIDTGGAYVTDTDGAYLVTEA